MCDFKAVIVLATNVREKFGLYSDCEGMESKFDIFWFSKVLAILKGPSKTSSVYVYNFRIIQIW